DPDVRAHVRARRVGRRGRQEARRGAHLTVWTIVVAAGSGERFGERKQYQRLGATRVLDWSLRAARVVSDGVVVVVPADLASETEPLADVVVAGGATRSASVRAGLDAVPDE